MQRDEFTLADEETAVKFVSSQRSGRVRPLFGHGERIGLIHNCKAILRVHCNLISDRRNLLKSLPVRNFRNIACMRRDFTRLSDCLHEPSREMKGGWETVYVLHTVELPLRRAVERQTGNSFFQSPGISAGAKPCALWYTVDRVLCGQPWNT